MQLTLRDFDSEDEPPSWMPAEKWEDILAVSVLAGPLDSLCVHMAQHSDEWKAWYQAEKPDNEPLPISDKTTEQGRSF